MCNKTSGHKVAILTPPRITRKSNQNSKMPPIVVKTDGKVRGKSCKLLLVVRSKTTWPTGSVPRGTFVPNSWSRNFILKCPRIKGISNIEDEQEGKKKIETCLEGSPEGTNTAFGGMGAEPRGVAPSYIAITASNNLVTTQN